MRTIVAISTPMASGGVSMLRISGERAAEIAAKVFRPAGSRNVLEMKGYTACYGSVHDGETRLDDGVLLMFRAPHSYTGEDVAEITCHGGIYITRRVLQACLNAGAEPAEAGEFTKRALLAGKLSLTQAEAVCDIINARSEQYLQCSNAQREGALFRRIEEIKADITETAATLSAWIDYPDEMEDEILGESVDIAPLKRAVNSLGKLLATYDTGRLMREGVPTAIVGKPNAGKSTLMNLLAGVERSIVTDIEGTTRDIVEETVMLGDHMLRLADCAGIRDTDDVVEGIGVERMLKKLEEAVLVLAVFDGSRPLNDDDRRLMRHLEGKRCICIINKNDLENLIETDELKEKFDCIAEISAKNENSAEILAQAADKLLDNEKIDMNAGFIANERQRQCAAAAKAELEEAVGCAESGITADIICVMLEKALGSLSELSGESASETVIDNVFKRFCVGK